MKKIVVPMLLLLVMSFCFVGYSQNLKEGEIINKEFTPAHTQTVILPQIISNGKTCYYYDAIYVYHYSDDWAITIQGTVDNKEKTAVYHVTPEVYEECEVGGQFIYDKNYCQDEPQYTREKQDEQ